MINTSTLSCSEPKYIIQGLYSLFNKVSPVVQSIIADHTLEYVHEKILFIADLSLFRNEIRNLNV
jgi:hypothetical protein